jgi:uncharacterized OsmC-like protein
VTEQKVPVGLDPDAPTREIVYELQAKSLEGLRAVAHTEGHTFLSDEPEHVGGDHTAPAPLSYFVGGLAF